ncbi:hypothetical protein NQ317_007334 [Molorchus minor]|uniref:Uncharacterized protein n=1 Tax=Molorchus minor TaxID=1323400 RepID=A0ABQ9J9B5_9CUCU|nr:hypothetical protein NQ317_007334 [Molorchus minor]
MKKVNEKAFGFNMTILKILGLYPYNSCPKIYHVYAYSFYVIFTLPIPILSFANILIDRENNMQIFTENFFMVIEISTLMVKLLPFKNHPERIQRTLGWLNEDIFSTRLEKHGNMLEDSIRLGRKLSHTFFVVCVANVFLWALKALLSTERVLMLDVWVPFDVLKHNMLYWGTFLLVFLGVMNAAVGNAIIDTLIAGLIYQGATQLRILKDTLENLGQLTDDEVSEKKRTQMPKGII